MTTHKDSCIWNISAKILGMLWILDGLLQFQPQMFGSDFVIDVLTPNISNQPAFMEKIVLFGIYLWNFNPVLSNLAAALLQIAIGILLLFPIKNTYFRAGAYISIAWGMLVWFCGEGAGLLLTGNATFYTGAPGAVLLYVIIVFFLLYAEKISLDWLPRIAGWLFIAGAALQLQPINWTIDGTQGAAMAAMMEKYQALKIFPSFVSNLLGINPSIANVMLITALLVVGIALLIKPNRITGVITMVFLFVVWWVGQDFGMISSFPYGTATDPQTAPLVMLLILPLLIPIKGRARESFRNGSMHV